MYTQFYEFKEKPFKLVPDPHFLFMSDVHRSAISHLQYGLEERNGFVVITGEVGSGKTLLLRVLLNSLPKLTQVAKVYNTNFNARELLEHILNEFGIETHGETKPKVLAELKQFLLQAHSEHRDALLVIDEAQNLSLDALEELRMVSNLETHKEKLIQIVMVGQPQLRYKLNLHDLEQLKQRVTVQYHLPALSAEDAAGYIRHRLSVARGEPIEIFTAEAIQLIYDYSGGIPRLINVVSDAGLRLGYVEEKNRVDGEMIKEVIHEFKELEGPVNPEDVAKEDRLPHLDLYLNELNKKFQVLYEQMQKVYIHKGEESRLIYERLLNVDQEVQAQESLSALQERERKIFEKEREIHQKLFDASKRLDEINALKENLEEKQLEVSDKVKEADGHLRSLRERELHVSPEPKTEAVPGDAEKAFQNKIKQLESIRQRLIVREQELNTKMVDFKSVIHDLEQKKVLLDRLEQGKASAKPVGSLERPEERAPGRRFNQLVRKILQES